MHEGVKYDRVLHGIVALGMLKLARLGTEKDAKVTNVLGQVSEGMYHSSSSKC